MHIDPLIRNNVHSFGNPQARKTLLFVNGLGTDQSCWAQVIPAFEKDFRIVLFDNVGAIPENFAYFQERQSRYLNVLGYGLDILEICSALALDRVTLVGHSAGGLAAALAAAEQPERVERLVMIGASPRYANEGDYIGGFTEADIHAAYDVLTKDYPAWAEFHARMAVGNPQQQELARRFAEALMHIPQEMMLTVLCSILQTDHRADLSRLRCPTLIIQSSEDHFVPLSVAEYLHQQIRDSRLTIIEASGHLPHISAPEQIVAAMRDFVYAL